ncbi:sulfatase-like hydrolase/transferase [Ruficoccus amylovorans]|uniref:Sulfatase-like hydrolase/transferase n=2 Tax=Ruficoccus amylovorans TaxID=1804625 RepID=A0A842HKU0_9BACT|nr:sulfatase-like hydrolase/transferase [Ruficoccus amylovorans]
MAHRIGLAAPSSPASSGKPNILVIMSDEYNGDILSAAGNPVVKTPNLDALARNGVLFENAYCNSPLCVPSRLSFTSGKYISRTGAWNNSSWLPSDDYPSLPRLLDEAGYETVLCGKMHYDTTRRYGFEKDIGPGNESNKDGKDRRCNPAKLDEVKRYSKRFDEFRVGNEEDNGGMRFDKRVTRAATRYLENRKGADKPFFMLVGFLAPHYPLIIPEQYWKPYEGKVPMPEIPEGYLEALPTNYQVMRNMFKLEGVPDDLVKKGRELYYGYVTWHDKQVGKVLDALRKNDELNNTVIIYTSDHGENMGEHGLWWKNSGYDSSTRVPLIISWPERWRGDQRRLEACSLVDVVQTIAELAGVEPPSDWDGDSLVDWLDNPQAPWKDMAVSQYYAHCIASGINMIRMGKYKYVYHNTADADHPAEEELYDLSTDPQELNNLAGLPQYKQIKEDMFAALVEEVGENPEVTEMRCREEIAVGYNRNV